MENGSRHGNEGQGERAAEDTGGDLPDLGAHKAELAARYGVRRIAVFGSYARGEATPESDLDLLVEFSPLRGCSSLSSLSAT